MQINPVLSLLAAAGIFVSPVGWTADYKVSHPSGKEENLATATLLLVSGNMVGEENFQSESSAPFPEASVHFEQNATDEDVEVVFNVKGGDDGLVNLEVVSPDGRTVIDFTAPDSTTLGMRQFRFESPEPKDVEALKATYPQGTYEFVGESVIGETFVSESTLSHALPALATFDSPAPEEEEVSTVDAVISWGAAEAVSGYIVEIEQDELGTRIEASLPSTATSFEVPNGFLSPGTEYELSIGTLTKEGNISFVETSFVTKS